MHAILSRHCAILQDVQARAAALELWMLGSRGRGEKLLLLCCWLAEDSELPGAKFGAFSAAECFPT